MKKIDDEYNLYQESACSIEDAIYQAVMDALKIGAPGIAMAGRYPIALNAAKKGAHSIKLMRAN